MLYHPFVGKSVFFSILSVLPSVGWYQVFGRFGSLMTHGSAPPLRGSAGNFTRGWMKISVSSPSPTFDHVTFEPLA